MDASHETRSEHLDSCFRSWCSCCCGEMLAKSQASGDGVLVRVSVSVCVYTCFWRWGLWCDRPFAACQPPAQDSEPPRGLTPRTARGSALCQAQKAAEARKARRARHGKRTICTVYRDARQRESQRFAERKENRGTCRRQSENPLNWTRHKVAELNWGIGRRCVALCCMLIFRPWAAKERSFLKTEGKQFTDAMRRKAVNSLSVWTKFSDGEFKRCLMNVDLVCPQLAAKKKNPTNNIKVTSKTC